MNAKLNGWPSLPYDHFRSTAHLLHMTMQVIGKLKLLAPFEPHWGNATLLLTSRGISSGLIPYNEGCFAINVDLLEHAIICTTTWGKVDKFKITSMSVATMTSILFNALQHIDVKASINPMPQEILHPIPFLQDTEMRTYDAELAHAWWQILIKTYRIMLKFHGRFKGIKDPIGLMWGTFDLRDIRFLNQPVPATGVNAGYIRRNAMTDAFFEVGFWHGNEAYPKPAYYAFLYPGFQGMEKIAVQPQDAHWDNNLGEFILDYEALIASKTPDADLFAFFNSTFTELSKKAGWDKSLNCPGVPV